MSATLLLQAVSVMLFVLFTATALLGIRTYGGAKAALWFAAATLAHALATATSLWTEPRLPWTILSGILLVSGLLALHRSFAEQLDRPRMLWPVQLTLVAFAIVGLGLCARLHLTPQFSLLIPSLVAAIQLALTASVVFSFTGEVSAVAGRFVGMALLMYALTNLLRAEAAMRFGSPHYPREIERTGLLCLLVGIFAGTATTFGFGFIASGKQRIELLWRAQIDELTGLLNRWAFKRIAVRETFRSMRRLGALSVVMMDLDGMKRVNDQLGHGCGDAVLQAVAASLQSCLRERDSVARMGGDEFCILLPETDLEHAISVAERLRAEIDTLPIRYRGEIVKIRASFGVSCSAQSGWSWQALVDKADAALYDAKRAGNLRVMAATPALDAPEVAAEPTPAIPERRRRS